MKAKYILIPLLITLGVGVTGVGGYFGVKYIADGIRQQEAEKEKKKMRQVVIHTDDNESFEVTAKIGETFTLENLPTKENLDFFGCYATSDFTGKKYINAKGTSVTWADKYPSDLYARFIDSNDLVVQSEVLFDEQEYLLGANFDSVLKFDNYYQIKIHYDRDYDTYIDRFSYYDLNLSFNHWEATNTIFLNWINFKFYLGEEELLDEGTMSSNDKFRTLTRTFQIQGSKILDSEGYVQIQLKLPSGNAAGKSTGCHYTDFKFTMKKGHLITSESIEFNDVPKIYEVFSDNGGIPLSGVTGACNSNTIEIPIEDKIEYFIDKYQPFTSYVHVKFVSYGWGKKSDLFYDNWITYYINPKTANGSKIFAEDISFSINQNSNDQYVFTDIPMTMTQLKMTKSFSVRVDKGGKGLSYTEAYFVKEQGIQIKFPTDFAYNIVGSSPDKYAKIYGMNYNFGESIEIPAKIEDADVTQIIDFGIHDEVKNLTLPSTITFLDDYVFTNLKNLANVYINSSQLITCTTTAYASPFKVGVKIHLVGGSDELLEAYKSSPMWAPHKDNIFLA